jgi:hypothetical protein
MLHETGELHSESGCGQEEYVEIEHGALPDHEVCVMLCDLQLVLENA